MAADQDFIPNKDTELDNWLTNFKDKLPGHSAELDLTDGQVDTAQTQCTQTSQAIQTVFEKKAQLQQIVQSKENLKKTNIGALRELIGKIKKKDGYTNDIGKDLKIIGTAVVFDPNALKPVLKLEKVGLGILIKWKKDVADGLRIEASADGTVWNFLAIDMEPDYLDSTGTAGRKYRAIYILNDEAVGQWSDVAEI